MTYAPAAHTQALERDRQKVEAKRREKEERDRRDKEAIREKARKAKEAAQKVGPVSHVLHLSSPLAMADEGHKRNSPLISGGQGGGAALVILPTQNHDVGLTLSRYTQPATRKARAEQP